MKKLFLLLLLTIGLIAGNYENALNAYQHKNYTTAKILFEKSAKEGNPSAQYYLGRIYDKSQGTERDRKNALQWYIKAEKKGDSMAEKRMDTLRHNTEAKWLDPEVDTIKIHGIKIIFQMSTTFDSPSGSGVIYEVTFHKDTHKKSCLMDESPTNNYTIDQTCEFLDYSIHFNKIEGKIKVTVTKW